MKILFDYSKATQKFLNKNNSNLSNEVLEELLIISIKKIYKIDDSSIDLKQLKGNFNGFYRIRKGNIRIIFNLKENKENNQIVLLVCFVKDIDFRGNIYE